MSPDNAPNVLFVVLDAARYDYLRESPVLAELADEHLSFANAVAPSTWSLPSHPSLFSGELPSRHGCYRVTDQRMDSLPLVDYFSDRGYRTAAVSANGFASPRNGFHLPFDEFYYTSDWGPFSSGLNVTEHAFRVRNEHPDISTRALTKMTLSEAVRQEHPVKSLCNFIVVSLNRLSSRIPLLQRIPHPLFNPYSQYSYRPETNTQRITSFLSETDEPFFLFTNYMDTHRPYAPPAAVQEELLGDSLGYREVARLNEVAAPWEYVRRVAEDENLQADTERICSLYAGEMISVGEHVDRLIEELKGNDLYEETLVVITSDHGENLGEIDLLGNRRMGHEASISHELLHVPLLIVNPTLDSYRVDSPVSIRHVFDFLVEGLDTFPASSAAIAEFFRRESPVVAEYPASGGEELFERYPDVPEQAIELRTSVHHAVALDEGWTVIADSRGGRLAFEAGAEREYYEAPNEVRSACEASLERLRKQDNDDSYLSDEEVSQLEALGYL
jgi:arylsulfatase A-like enzyme